MTKRTSPTSTFDRQSPSSRYPAEVKYKTSKTTNTRVNTPTQGVRRTTQHMPTRSPMKRAADEIDLTAYDDDDGRFDDDASARPSFPFDETKTSTKKPRKAVVVEETLVRFARSHAVVQKETANEACQQYPINNIQRRELQLAPSANIPTTTTTRGVINKSPSAAVNCHAQGDPKTNQHMPKRSTKKQVPIEIALTVGDRVIIDDD
ncbi:Aste57867_4299 [Aphanomyces stellatus]|uniref:Aste57867_4299 protein n=1 Tax=Aphanomyces stellatus TaxID=120398 RepID=A0A485KDM0_9STRA|nr:hypothetical protein As57867_004288 [Aphanomyces stellatus]VFT81414.1 Aste57867_4299 [Aphanomyces stellatus]